MRRRFVHGIALGLTFSTLGCATALNVQDASLRKPYGGVTMPITEFFGGNASGEAAEYSSLFFWPFWLFDKPLSLVGDTITLPYLLWTQRNPSLPGCQSGQPKLARPAPGGKGEQIPPVQKVDRGN